jgi:protein-S-isoprenylcysteine O-methyltransferase Ste14
MPPLTPVAAIYAIWILFAASWLLAAALWSSRAQSRPAFGAQLRYSLLNVIGAILLFNAGPRAVSHFGRLRIWTIGVPGTTPLWAVPEWAGWACVALAAAGCAFAWWARIHLGALWSGSITRKADHRIVDTGPYGLVRHPIYTGLIAAAFALAADKASPVAFLGAVLVAAGWWLKARTEEAFLRQELGPDLYDAYRKRVPMLVPFFPA